MLTYLQTIIKVIYLFLPRYATRCAAVRCPSVCMSVWHGLVLYQNDKHMLNFFHHPVDPSIIVYFTYQMLWQYSEENPSP